MPNLTEERDTKTRDGKMLTFPVSPTTTLYKGGMVAISQTTGTVVPAGENKDDKVIGMLSRVDYEAGLAVILRGTYLMNNADGLIAVTLKDVGKKCSVFDDNTVCKYDATRAEAGVLIDVDDSGAWVTF
jgi:hypothetical protein